MVNPTIEAALILGFLFLLSLFGAYITLIVMKGTALVKRKGLRLGGSAGMFILTFVLLNTYLPEVRDGIMAEGIASAQPIITRDESGKEEIVKVFISPAAQLTTSHDILRLDKNDYKIFEKSGLAIPLRGFEISHLTEIPVVGISDIPAFKLGMKLFSTLFGQKDAVIFGIMSEKVDKIQINKASKVDGIQADLNIFEDNDYVKSAIQAQHEMMLSFTGKGKQESKEITDVEIKKFKGLMVPEFQKNIDRELPISREMRSGVYVVPLSDEMLNLNTAKYLTSLTLLDKANMFLALSGFSSSLGMTNSYIDNNRGIMSFNSSAYLENVEVNGKKDNVRINNVGFIVTGNNNAYLVLLIYLSTQDIQVFRNLERVLNGLRFVG